MVSVSMRPGKVQEARPVMVHLGHGHAGLFEAEGPSPMISPACSNEDRHIGNFASDSRAGCEVAARGPVVVRPRLPKHESSGESDLVGDGVRGQQEILMSSTAVLRDLSIRCSASSPHDAEEPS